MWNSASTSTIVDKQNTNIKFWLNKILNKFLVYLDGNNA